MKNWIVLFTLSLSCLALASTSANFSTAKNALKPAVDLPGCSIGEQVHSTCGYDANGTEWWFSDPGCSVTCSSGTPTCTQAYCNGLYNHYDSACTCN
jgi:hypothetical protein